jgi:hypothetical protein
MSKAPIRPKQKGEAQDDTMVTTAIHIRKDTWNLLREVAFRRAQANGGRTSVSELVRTLVEARRAELESELRKFNN